MSKLKAIVFDADGTLMNTKELILAAYRHVAQAHGLQPPTDDEIMVHMGKSLRDIYAGLFPAADADTLVKANGEFMLAHAFEVQAFDGMEDVLQNLRNAGLQLALLTGGNHKIEALLEHHGIAHYFGSVVHSERITKQKPDPEGLQLALRELGDVLPEEAIMVGDMRYDILAGKNTGVRVTIGLTHGMGTRAELEAAGADHIVANLAELQALLRSKYLT